MYESSWMLLTPFGAKRGFCGIAGAKIRCAMAGVPMSVGTGSAPGCCGIDTTVDWLAAVAATSCA